MKSKIYPCIILLLFLFFTFTSFALNNNSSGIGSPYSSPINPVGATAPLRTNSASTADDDDEETLGDWGSISDPISTQPQETPVGSTSILIIFAAIYAICSSLLRHKKKKYTPKSLTLVLFMACTCQAQAVVNFNGGQGCYFYFDNTNTQWDSTYCFYLIYGNDAPAGRVRLYKIPATNLYVNSEQKKINGLYQYVAIVTSETQMTSNHWDINDLSKYFKGYSTICTNPTLCSSTLITPSTGEHPTLTFQTSNPTHAWDICNTNVTLGVRYALDGNSITAQQINAIKTGADGCGWAISSLTSIGRISTTPILLPSSTTASQTVSGAISSTLYASADENLAKGFMFLGYYPDGDANLSSQEAITTNLTYACTIPCLSSMYAVYGKKVNVTLLNDGDGTLTFSDGQTTKSNTLVSEYPLTCTPKPGYQLDHYTIQGDALKTCTIENGILKMESNLDSTISQVSITAHFSPATTTYHFHFLAPHDWETVYMKIGNNPANLVTDKSGSLFSIQLNSTYAEGITLQNAESAPTQSLSIIPCQYDTLDTHTYTIIENALQRMEPTASKQLSGNTIQRLIFDKNSDIEVTANTTINDMYATIEFKQDECADKGIQRYWFSLPFACQISSVTGLDSYSEKWVIQRYRGDLRAEQGYTNSPFWRNLKGTATLEANRGYVLAINLQSTDFANGIARLYFPGGKQTVSPTAEITLPTFTDETTPNTDWNWNIMGMPLLTATSGEYAQANFPKYIYAWNGSNYSVEASEDIAFLPLTGYMVQSNNCINWAYQYPKQVPLYLRSIETESFKFALIRNGKTIDKTYLTLSETATTGYDLGEDLIKMQENQSSVIYTYVNGTKLAAAALPLSVTQIPLGIETIDTAQYALCWLNANQTSNLVPHLYDALTQTYTALTSQLALPISNESVLNRFEIALIKRDKDSTTALGQCGSAWLESSNNGIFIHGISSSVPVRIYDTMGRLILESSAKNHDFIPTPQGLVLVQIETETHLIWVK